MGVGWGLAVGLSGVADRPHFQGLPEAKIHLKFVQVKKRRNATTRKQ